MESKLLKAQAAYPGPRFATPVFVFIAAGARLLNERLVDSSPRQCWNLMLQATEEWLADEKIEFGDDRYAWDENGARDLADEYILQYAEPVA